MFSLGKEVIISLHSLPLLFFLVLMGALAIPFPFLKICYTSLSPKFLKAYHPTLSWCPVPPQDNSVPPQAVKHLSCKLRQLTPLLYCVFPNSFSGVKEYKLKKKVRHHEVDTFCARKS